MIKQLLNSEESFTVGKNGLRDIYELHVWEGGGKVWFDVVGKSGKILNAGIVIDKEAFVALVEKINKPDSSLKPD